MKIFGTDDQVQVVRVLVYTGPRDWVERTLEGSQIGGFRKFHLGSINEVFVSTMQEVSVDEEN